MKARPNGRTGRISAPQPREAAGSSFSRYRDFGGNLDVVVEFAKRGMVWPPLEADMLSRDLVQKTRGPIIIRSVVNRTRLPMLAALLICASLGPGPREVRGAEIHTGSASTPAGFADVVARVKPAVIAVTVRLETVAKATNDPDAPSPSTPFSENSPLHHYFFGNPQQHRAPRPLHTLLWLWAQAFLYLLMDTR